MSILHTRHDVAGFTIPLASCLCNYLYHTMKRLDQSPLHPKLEVPRLTWPSREANPGLPGWEASTLEKSHSKSFLAEDVGRITLARHQQIILPAAKTSGTCKSVFSMSSRIIPLGSPLWRYLTKFISILNKRSSDWHVPAGNQTWASVVGGEQSRKEPFKQHVNCYSEHLHMSSRPWIMLKTEPFYQNNFSKSEQVIIPY